MKKLNIKCDHKYNPIGIDSKEPRFSWMVQDVDGHSQQMAYQILVKKDSSVVWNTGKIHGEVCSDIKYQGEKLESTTEYTFDITVWTSDGHEEVGTGFFETALLKAEDWKAKWIEPIQNPAFTEQPPTTMNLGICQVNVEEIKMEPAQIMRKAFELTKPVVKARAYATAHGIYYLELNGQRIGDRYLTPGNTSYNKYLEYQTYDITGHLNSGGNALVMVLGDGWYRGKVGISGGSCQYGDKVAGLLQIEVYYMDGTKEVIASDKSFKSSTGPIEYADIFVGQKYNALKEEAGYNLSSFNDDHWQLVETKDYGYGNLYAEYGDPVRIVEVVKPKKVWRAPNGDLLLDAGQVLSGRLRMRVKADEATKIVLEHTETLDKEGNFTCNIIGSFVNQTDTYICKGEGEEVFDPEFTYHGFRYVRITGYPDKASIDDFDVLVLQSDIEKIGEFGCSDQRINQLQHNIYWSLRSNFLSIPTDCPQREKAGWTGDVQIIAPTACYNMDVKAFFSRWLRNVQKDQLPDGQVPNIVPYLKAYHPNDFMPNNTHCSAGWGDVSIILPWMMYKAYGDISILEDNYKMMKKWVEYIRLTSETEFPEKTEGIMTEERKAWQKYLWNTNFHFGDWLTPSVSFNFETGDVDMIKSAFETMDIIPTIFYAYSTELIAKVAHALGHENDVHYYNALHEKVVTAFINEYVDDEGLISTKLQGVYVLALKMDLIPEKFRKNTLKALKKMIIDNGKKLDTGFLSVPFLLELLVEEGEVGMAYDLLFQDECPSWLYEVKMGATTMWEAWQAILPDGTTTSVSYNHYAFGCIGDWMYRHIAGIQQVSPGYKTSRIKPSLDNRLNSAHGSVITPYGKLESKWSHDGKTMTMNITVPPNTTSEIHKPQLNGSYEVEKVNAGSYEFKYALI